MYISDVRSSLIITLQPHRRASQKALVISWCLLGVKTSNRGVRRGTAFLSMLFLRKKARPQQHTSFQNFLEQLENHLKTAPVHKQVGKVPGF